VGEVAKQNRARAMNEEEGGGSCGLNVSGRCLGLHVFIEA
jgi:hypothetical protein